MQQPRRIKILGVAINDTTEAEALATVASYIAKRGPHQVVTVNPEFVMEARRNAAFRRVLAAADLATPDGIGIVLAARLRGERFRARVTGIGLVRAIARDAAGRGWRLFLLGAAPGVAERAAAALRDDHPGLVVVGCHAGSPRPDDEAAIRQLVLVARPDVLLVAYGHPAQELWIARNQPLLRVPVAIGVGGTFDELAGVVRPTPALVQRLGLKWAYRLWQQPQRLPRIIDAVPRFAIAALADALRRV